MMYSEQSEKVRSRIHFISFNIQDEPAARPHTGRLHALIREQPPNPQYRGVGVEAHLEVCCVNASLLAIKSKAVKTKKTFAKIFYIYRNSYHSCSSCIISNVKVTV